MPDAHREAARLAVERGPLEVWVNNAGVLRTRKTWEHTDEEVRLLAEVNVLGVMWGSGGDRRHARARGQNMHVINLASLSALAPVPGVADAVVELLDSKQLVLVIPRWRGWLARSTALAGRHATAGAEPLRKLGERRR